MTKGWGIIIKSFTDTGWDGNDFKQATRVS